MSSSAKNVYSPLPSTITNSVTTYEGREEFVVKYLKKLLPSSDNKEVLKELRRTFILDKHKAHGRRKLPEKVKGKNYWKHKHPSLRRIGKEHDLTYKELLSLNEMWLEYVRQNLGLKDFENLPNSPVDPHFGTIGQRLLKVDFHGAVISVIRSKDTSTVGTQGIIVQETKNCFTVVTTKNRVRLLPKDSSVFKFHLPNASLEVHGTEIRYKPADRSIKKFKVCHLGEL